MAYAATGKATAKEFVFEWTGKDRQGKEMRGEMRKAGFGAFQTLPFPQPCYPTGWWSCTLARKGQGFGFRESDARAKPFATKYYSADIHKGAQVLPPFVAEALGG